MEEADSKKSDISARKRIRRRTHTRKVPLSCFISMTEARREIVNALQLHRSSSASDSKTTNSCGVKINNPAILSSCNQKYYHRLINSMPIPEPTWSTTAPSVLQLCSAPVPPVHEVMEFELFDNLSSSYSWWVGFLNSLDSKNSVNDLMENSEGLVQCSDSENFEKSASDQSPFMDEWLIFPASEEHEEQV